ncbi:MAG: MATE family efflux transporter [Parabacteroides sp.]|nr:MATE family efflux transporter [Parabacteroides sp.]
MLLNAGKYKTHYIRTLRLGAPIMLGQLGIIVVGFADNIMVGHHSTAELAAASFVNNFFTLAFIFGMGFSYGLTPLVGSLFANGRYKEIGVLVKNSLFINFIVGILLSQCMFVLLLRIDVLEQPPELMPYIVPYYLLQLFSVIFAMLFNSFKQFADGTTDTRTPMWIMLGANVLNIIGNYFLIYGKCGVPELGLTGAGISTLVSRIGICLVFAFLFFKREKYGKYAAGFREGRVNRNSLSRLTRLGLPVGLQMGVETASFSLSVVMMGWLGSIALAAHQIVGVVTTLGFMIYYGIAAAVTIRVSNYLGKKEIGEIRRATVAGLHLVLATACIVVVLIGCLRHRIGYLFTTDAQVAGLVAVLSFSVMLYQFGDGLQIVYSNALRGVRDVTYMAIAAFGCHFLLSLPIGYFCGFVLGWGAVGIWCGFPVGLTTLGVILYFRFRKVTAALSKKRFIPVQ